MASDIIWSQFCDAQKIDLSHKNIEYLPNGISVCEGVELLNLEFNTLENLPTDLGDLKCLRVLRLRENALPRLPECVTKLAGLRELHAAHNRIELVSKYIGNLYDLIILDLSHNKLVKLSVGVGFLSGLQRVDLSFNLLTSVPHELTALCGLVEIDISHNKVRKLPCVRNLLHLKIFKANNNQLKKLQDFSQCQELVHVNFSHNLIEEIDSASLNCQPFLKEMLLNNNKIHTIPEDLILLCSLRLLNISSNQLDSLPSNLVDYPSLQTLKIDDNPLKDIPKHYARADTCRLMMLLRRRAAEADSPPIPTLTHASLSVLRRSGSLVHSAADSAVLDDAWDTAVTAGVLIVNLSHCKQPVSQRLCELGGWLVELHLVDCGLGAVPAAVAALTELQVLTLDHNQLTATGLGVHLAACTHLCHLSLSYNRLEEVPAVVLKLTKLRVLNVSNNQLRELSGLNCLTFLNTLDASNNEITHLDPQIGLMSRLASLILTGNRFRQPSHQLLAKGTAPVLAYLRNKLPPPPQDDCEQAPPRTPPTNVSYFIS